jgi:hypothetical protein
MRLLARLRRNGKCEARLLTYPSHGYTDHGITHKGLCNHRGTNCVTDGVADGVGVPTHAWLSQGRTFPAVYTVGCEANRLRGGGVVAIDTTQLAYLAGLNHEDTRIAVGTERAFLMALDGSCRTPIAGYAHKGEDGKMKFSGLVAKPDGSVAYRCSAEGEWNYEAGEKLGFAEGTKLKEQAGEEFFEGLKVDNNWG